MKERNDFEQWNDYVNSFERNEAWRMSLEIANMVLEAYFQSRDSFPGTSLMGEDLVDDSKTTDEIVEEVSTMMDIEKRSSLFGCATTVSISKPWRTAPSNGPSGGI